MSNKNEKKNRLNILRVKIKDFIVPFLNVQSIMCTLTRFNKQRSKKMNICTSKLYLRLTFRWIIQNVALLKQHIFLIRENWSVLLLSNRRNFRVFCLNSAALKPTFHFVWKKARYFAESIWKICLKGPFFTENAILENTKQFRKRSLRHFFLTKSKDQVTTYGFQGEWALHYFCDRLPLTLEKRDKKSDLPQSSSSTKSKFSQVKDGRNLALNHIPHQS